MSTYMKPEHANAILQGGARMPKEGEACDMSCQFSFACAQFNENGTCRGFLLKSNGELSQHIKANVAEACKSCLKETPCENCTKKTLSILDRIGIENYVKMIQRTHDPETLQHLVPVVHRYLTPPQSRKRPTHQRNGGLREMLEHAYNSPKEKNEEVPQPPVGATSGFQRQLEASKFGGSQNTLELIRQTPKSPERPANRFLGFDGMLTAAFGSPQQERTEPPQRFQSAFQRMLHAAAHGGTQIDRSLATPNVHTQNRDGLYIPMGFRAMLDSAFGKQEKCSSDYDSENFAPRPIRIDYFFEPSNQLLLSRIFKGLMEGDSSFVCHPSITTGNLYSVFLFTPDFIMYSPMSMKTTPPTMTGT